ncbi:hypothetical protein HOLleu_13849 [Holothuria leucospilota]|uniref:Uncharacterized protein n=1 Tax=Holothuria leucospilota TaxID=206669 RepID=A0A9Q1HBV4_HOLLE|nr:hypothetical protein HOLleu_13849 [Holothuria leucospilota]
MEKIGFTRCMDYLIDKVKVKEVVTDGHLQIAALMRNAAKYKGIEHQNDKWNGSKTLTKMIMKAAKSKENKVLIDWMPAIRNRFWFSSRICNGDEKALKATLLDMLLHIVNHHE